MALLLSGLPDLVDDDEDIVRFLTQSNRFSREKMAVKPGTFLPDRSGETSVFRHGRSPSDRLWDIGQHAAGEHRNLYGAALLKASAVRSAKLRLEAAEPPLRHAAIRGWPQNADNPRMEKVDRVAIDQELAAVSELILIS